MIPKLGLVTVLTDPDEFFQSGRASFPGALGIVGAATVINLVSALTFVQWLAPALPDRIQGAVTTGIVFAFAISLAFSWFIVAGVGHAVSAFFNGEGSFATTFQYVGWGYLPDLLVAPVTFVGVLYLTATRSPPSVERIEAFEASVYADPVLQTTSLLSVVALVVSAYIWTYALVHARNVSPTHAALSIGLPVLWYLYDGITTLFAGR